jgi:hypothetical protein
MKVLLIETSSGNTVQAIIASATKKDMPLKKSKWNFDWKGLFKTEGAHFYKIYLESTPEIIEGLVMITIINGEMIFMNNLEISPSNYGSSGKHSRVAGCLIAFACKFSIKNGKGNYKGFLSFDSKTEIVELYHKKYGATLARGLKMFISPQKSIELVEKFLNGQIT